MKQLLHDGRWFALADEDKGEHREDELPHFDLSFYFLLLANKVIVCYEIRRECGVTYVFEVNY